MMGYRYHCSSVGAKRILLLAAATTINALHYGANSRKHHRGGPRCDALQQQEGDNYYYTPLELPTRSQLPSHAIHGALLRQDLIESYTVKKRRVLPVGDDATTAPPRVVVIGTARLGSGVDGHHGIVHGGILALLIDDVLGFGFHALGVPMAFTANLNVNYVRPVPACTTIEIQCSLERREGRKLFWSVVVVDADAPDIAYCNATSLYIIPREKVSDTSRTTLNGENSG